MANTKEKYESDILQVIKDNNLFNICDIFAFYTGCCRATFYNLGLEKLDSIKNALDDNKIKTCQSLKNKWYKSNNPALQLALFKTICKEEDRKALSMNYNDITSDNKAITFDIKLKSNAESND